MGQGTEVVYEQSTKTKTSITCEQSQKLIQTMLTMSFGCVAFLRGLFPDENFVDQRFVPNKFEQGYNPNDPKSKNDSIRVKTLARGKSTKADLFLDWIDKGATDAIRRGYLKSLSFAIFLNKDDPNDLHEVYTFFFDYKNDDIHFSINDEDEPISLLDSRKMLQQLMKRFIIITQSLEPLPEERNVSMRMLFNESCPKDYQPPFFKDASDEPSAILKAPKTSNVDRYSAGSVDTSFHSIQVKVLSRPILISNENEIIEIDPFEASQFKTPNMIKNAQLPPKSLNRFVKREPSQTTNMLRSFLESSQPEVKPTQAINHVKCECGSTEESDVSGTIKCASCDGILHGSCYGSSSRRQETTCFTCRSKAMGGIKTHQNLRLLFIARKLYKLFSKVDIPPSTRIIHEQLGFAISENTKATASVISFFFKKCILVLEDEPRKLKKQVGDATFQKGSSYVDVDIDGIYVNGKQLSRGRYSWSFVPKIYGPDLTAWKSSAARTKKFLFEDTLESGLAIDDNLDQLDISKVSIDEEQILNSSDQEIGDETKKSEEVTGYFSNLNLQSSEDYDIIQSSNPVRSTRKRKSSFEHDPIEIASSQPVCTDVRLKRKKVSVTKKVITADSFA